jgi:hypothetical protein
MIQGGFTNTTEPETGRGLTLFNTAEIMNIYPRSWDRRYI